MPLKPRMRPYSRALVVALVAALGGGCAHPEAPTGGPVPDTPLEVLATRPDTAAVVPGWRGPVVIVFDRALSERGVEEAVNLSPAPAGFVVDHRGPELRVQPRLGWRPGVIYHVEVAPGVADRFGNRLESPVRIVFSTGPEIPATVASGRVTDRIRGEPAVGARVDAVRVADSLTYSTFVDSAGRFSLERIPEGEYRIVGYRDANRNRRVDPFEPRDTAWITVAVGLAAGSDLALLLPDTTPPVAGSARMTEGWVEIRFDDHLDPDQALSPSQVTILGPDGSTVPVARVRVGAPPPADTARQDTLPPADSLPAARPLPSQALFAEPAVDLVPDAVYTVEVRGVRNLHGLVGGGEAPLRVPRAPEPEPEPEPPSEPSDAVPDEPADDVEDPPPPAPMVAGEPAGP